MAIVGRFSGHAYTHNFFEKALEMRLEISHLMAFNINNFISNEAVCVALSTA